MFCLFVHLKIYEKVLFGHRPLCRWNGEDGVQFVRSLPTISIFKFPQSGRIRKRDSHHHHHGNAI